MNECPTRSRIGRPPASRIASAAGANITELVVNHRPRLYGKSKYGLWRTFKVMLDLITVKFLLSYRTTPMYLFGGFGLGLLFALIQGFLAYLLGQVELGLNLYLDGFVCKFDGFGHILLGNLIHLPFHHHHGIS